MKLAIIDIDGVVADATKRFERADEVKAAYNRGDATGYDGYNATDIYWRAALDPEFVHLDTLIDGVNEHLLDLQSQGYKVVFLTSRPATMYEATVDWLFAHTVYDADDELIMKAPGFQYVKTPVWKVGMAQTLISFYNADEGIFVDDEQAHWPQLPNVRCSSSLKAIFEPPAPVDTSDPFLPDE